MIEYNTGGLAIIFISTPPTPVFWPGEFHGLYSPCGHKELDTTEGLSLSLSNKVHQELFSNFLFDFVLP